MYYDGTLLLYNTEQGTQISAQSVFQISNAAAGTIDPLFTEEMEREAISIYVNNTTDDSLNALDDDDDCEICNQPLSSQSGGANTTSSPSPGLTEIPLASWQQDILKRARQIKEIKWTCLKRLTGWYGVKYNANTVYRGIPYGQPSHAGRYIPWRESFATFLSNSKIINSVFYTGRSEDKRGRTSTYYAADCSSFVSYAWALKNRETTSGLDNSNISVEITAPANEDIIYSLQVGDCINKARNHAILVASVKRDASG